MITVATSFHPQGWGEYGHDFLKQFAKHWPSTVRLVIYHEWPPLAFSNLNLPYYREVEWRHVSEAQLHDHWMGVIAPFRLMRGDMGDGRYNIQFDARQCRKVWFEHAAVHEFGGKVFWVDADVYTHADVTEDFLNDILPDDKFSCFLGRRNFYTESGFLGFNSGHEALIPFFHLYQSILLTGAIFTQRGWHDCIAYDCTRTAQGMDADAFVDLGLGVDPGPGLQVFNNSILGAFMDHRKGQRKGRRSPIEELTVPRPEPYWQAGSQRDHHEKLFEDHGPLSSPKTYTTS